MAPRIAPMGHHPQKQLLITIIILINIAAIDFFNLKTQTLPYRNNQVMKKTTAPLIAGLYLACAQTHAESSNPATAWLASAAPFATIESELSYTDSDGFSGESASDLVISAVEFGATATVTEHIGVEVSFLYEEDDTDLEVDVATINFDQIPNTPFNLSIGQTYLPFGQLETALVNDTLVLELAEIRETAAVVGWQKGELSAAAYLFNGDIDTGNDTLENFGLSLRFGNELFSAGFDYISNVLDSDGITGALEDTAAELATDLAVDERVGAFSLNGQVSLDQIKVFGEYLQLETLDSNDINVLSEDIEPSALQIEAVFEQGPRRYALSYQQTDESAALGLPETRLAIGASHSFNGNISVGAEYWYDEDYSASNGGSGDDANSIVLQLSINL